MSVPLAQVAHLVLHRGLGPLVSAKLSWAWLDSPAAHQPFRHAMALGGAMYRLLRTERGNFSGSFSGTSQWATADG